MLNTLFWWGGGDSTKLTIFLYLKFIERLTSMIDEVHNENNIYVVHLKGA